MRTPKVKPSPLFSGKPIDARKKTPCRLGLPNCKGYDYRCDIVGFPLWHQGDEFPPLLWSCSTDQQFNKEEIGDLFIIPPPIEMRQTKTTKTRTKVNQSALIDQLIEALKED